MKLNKQQIFSSKKKLDTFRFCPNWHVCASVELYSRNQNKQFEEGHVCLQSTNVNCENVVANNWIINIREIRLVKEFFSSLSHLSHFRLFASSIHFGESLCALLITLLFLCPFPFSHCRLQYKTAFHNAKYWQLNRAVGLDLPLSRDFLLKAKIGKIPYFWQLNLRTLNFPFSRHERKLYGRFSIKCFLTMNLFTSVV